MNNLDLLARILTAPFRIAKRLFQNVLAMVFIAVLLVVAPIYSLFTMPGYQHDTNLALRQDYFYSQARMDFATNTLVDGASRVTQFAVSDDYKSLNAINHGTIPAQWGLFNVIGFGLADDGYGRPDDSEWARGKGAPMYAAYAEAAQTTDNLRDTLSTLKPGAHIVLPDAPQITISYVADQGLTFTGVCPANSCDSQDYQFRESRDLFTPSMTAGQAKAIAQMQYTMTDEYWLHEAQANGIHDDGAVREAARTNRDSLLATYTPARNPSHATVALEIGYLLIVLTMLVGLVFKVIRFIFY